MKKIIYFSFHMLLFFLLSLDGCGSKHINIDQNNNSELSDSIHILYEIDKIPKVQEASIYIVDYFQPDTSILMEELLQYDVKETECHALGRSYFTDAPNGKQEGLIVYDGGKEFGIYTGIYGGFFYFFEDFEKNYQDVINIYPDHPDQASQLYGYTLNEDFSKWEDLEFMSVKDAISIFKEIAIKCYLPEIKIDTVYSLDWKTMQKHSEMKMNYSEDNDLTAWTKEEEAYLLYFVQVVDGIPLVNHMWEAGARKEPTEVPIYAFLSANGCIEFHIEQAVNVISEIERQTIISPEEAEHMLLEELNRSLQISNVNLETLKLSYVTLHDKEERKLVPAWIFCIARESIAENSYTQERIPIKKYEHFIVNAISGERIRMAVNE